MGELRVRELEEQSESKGKKKDDSTDGSSTDSGKTNDTIPDRQLGSESGDENESSDKKKVEKGPKEENSRTKETKPDLRRLSENRGLLGVSLAGNEIIENLAGDARMLAFDDGDLGELWLSFVATDDF